MSQPPFHLAFPVHDLDAARAFYVDLLGCGVGRTSDTWIDFDFWGHQVVAHLAPDNAPVARNDVDGKQVPSRHFGVVVPWQEWEALDARFWSNLMCALPARLANRAPCSSRTHPATRWNSRPSAIWISCSRRMINRKDP